MEIVAAKHNKHALIAKRSEGHHATTNNATRLGMKYLNKRETKFCSTIQSASISDESAVEVDCS